MFVWYYISKKHHNMIDCISNSFTFWILTLTLWRELSQMPARWTTLLWLCTRQRNIQKLQDIPPHPMPSSLRCNHCQHPPLGMPHLGSHLLSNQKTRSTISPQLHMQNARENHAPSQGAWDQNWIYSCKVKFINSRNNLPQNPPTLLSHPHCPYGPLLTP